MYRNALESEEISRLKDKANSADSVSQAALSEAVDLQKQTQKLSAELASARQKVASSETSLAERDR